MRREEGDQLLLLTLRSAAASYLLLVLPCGLGAVSGVDAAAGRSGGDEADHPRPAPPLLLPACEVPDTFA